ncbi:3789_t:CDS:2 [Ambispora gerdemannii]|uniref:3789_t:CDS:1 n=1 Tax=Ambispora gerdemannii TaxID=144530 RepID=A0A9N9C8E1_9GLOM|nr:3789_t:CDS:2 [Ambispora gerdemannii]
MSKLIPISDDEFNLMKNTVIPLNGLSITSSLLVVVIYLLMYKYYPALADRVSLRLGVATSVADSMYAFIQLLLFSVNHIGFWCSLSAWSFVFTSLLANLQIIFLHEYKGHRNFEKYYFIGAIFFANLISLLPLIQSMYGYDEPEQLCWYRDSGSRINIIWQWTTLFGWLELSAIYCAIIFIAVLLKAKALQKDIKSGETYKSTMNYLQDPEFGETYSNLHQHLDHGHVRKHQTKQIKTFSLVSMIVRKISWYPVVPLITQAPNFLVETFAYSTQRISFTLLLLTTMFAATQGFLNALVFANDIAVGRGFLAFKIYLWKKYVEEYETRYPHRSQNKKHKNKDSARSNEEHHQPKTTKDVIIPEIVIEESPTDLTKLKDKNLIRMWEPTFLEHIQYQFISKLIKVSKETLQSDSHQESNDNQAEGTESIIDYYYSNTTVHINDNDNLALSTSSLKSISSKFGSLQEKEKLPVSEPPSKFISHYKRPIKTRALLTHLSVPSSSSSSVSSKIMPKDQRATGMPSSSSSNTPPYWSEDDDKVEDYSDIKESEYVSGDDEDRNSTSGSLISLTFVM